MRDLIVGTAGHIDHGKTTLLKALTGIDADRLKEEKRRGITIDIGFAHMDLEGWRLGFIDVPGHERFVKNMLCGVGGIQLVLLVVAADESVMPQTEEHFQICRLLKIPTGIIVLTKKNNVDPELLEVVEEEVKDLVAGSFLEKAAIVAVDSVGGEGIDALKESLLETILRLPSNPETVSPSQDCFFRLPIDRVFSIRGFGTVVTGTPYAGQVAGEQTLQVYPGDGRSKVRGVQIFNQKSSQAAAGQRTALNLAALETKDLDRGMILAPPGAFHPSYMLDVELELLAQAPAPLEHRSPVRFHHGSGELLGRVYLLEGRELEPGARCPAQLRLDTPTVCCLKDRFILRRYSPMTTIGGGVILDGAPRKHNRAEAARILPRLEALAQALRDGSGYPNSFIEYYVELEGADGLDLDRLASRTGILPKSLLRLVRSLDAVVVTAQDPPRLVSKTALEDLQKSILEFLKSFHQQQPLAMGASREEIKRRFLPSAAPLYFQFVIETLAGKGLLRVESGRIALAGRVVSLTDRHQEIRRSIIEGLEQAGWIPPSIDDVLREIPDDDQLVHDGFYYMLERGQLVRINEDLVLSSEGIDRLTGRLRDELSSPEGFSVADFKQLLGISRKYAIPYLEYLDRNRITQRLGDRRLVKGR